MTDGWTNGDARTFEHLVDVLQAIRSVNRLLATETEPARLLQGVCDLLVEDRGYHSCWIAEVDRRGWPVRWAGGGFGADFDGFDAALREGREPPCWAPALAEPEVQIHELPAAHCGACPLMKPDRPTRTMIRRIAHEGRVLGLVAASVPGELLHDPRERELFAELSDDIGLALSKIDAERARTEAERRREEAEAQREALIVELRAKNAELERFAYTISHDLKSPLITIKGFLGTLEQDMASGDTERVRDALGRIGRAADRMRTLLDQLLELSRIGRVINPPERVGFRRLVDEALEQVAGRVAEQGVEVEVAEDLPVVRVDRPRMVEVLQNLLDNAVKFMGDQPAPRVAIGHRRENGAHLFWVEDNGSGIHPDYLERVFGLFDKLDQGSAGTGLGLALARRILEAHGGRIWAASEGPGRGATFLFSLPARGETEQRRTEP